MNDSSSFFCVSTSHSIVRSNYFFVFFFCCCCPGIQPQIKQFCSPFFQIGEHTTQIEMSRHTDTLSASSWVSVTDPGDRCCFCYIISTYYIVFCLWFFTSFVPLSLLGFCWFRSTHHNYAEVCDDNSLERRNWRPSGSSALWLASCPVTCYRLTNPPTWFSCPMFPRSPSKKREGKKRREGVRGIIREGMIKKKEAR